MTTDPERILPSNVDAGSRTAPSWRVVQSPWLIAMLVFASFGLYAYWWFGRTWTQIKREDGDDGKRPVWHALATMVPIYGFFHFHEHMRAITQLAPSTALLQPGAMTVAWITIHALSVAANLPAVPLWIAALSAALAGALIGWGQDALNKVWRSLPGGAVQGRRHPLHWLVLVFGLIWAITLLSTPESALRAP